MRGGLYFDLIVNWVPIHTHTHKDGHRNVNEVPQDDISIDMHMYLYIDIYGFCGLYLHSDAFNI